MKEVPDFLLFQFVSRVYKLYYYFIAILQGINNLAKYVPYSQIILILLLNTKRGWFLCNHFCLKKQNFDQANCMVSKSIKVGIDN